MTAKRASDPEPRQMLRDRQIDHLGEAMLTLTRELWVLTDRVRILEAVLEDQGLDVGGAIATYVPSAEMETELAIARARLVDGVVKALTGPVEG
ncbi:hypothetical protein [Sphingobium aromaticiconvertens]|uniref:hypothetical protein n=1 Tax=Sphingobium aromaticiconvertens TaxID=365341 RepID=UPI003017F180